MGAKLYAQCDVLQKYFLDSEDQFVDNNFGASKKLKVGLTVLFHHKQSIDE
jgi:hypothetical protein